MDRRLYQRNQAWEKFEILERIMQGIRQEDLARVAAERWLREEKERELRLERAKNKEREDSLRLNIQRKSERITFFISRVVFGILMVLLALGALYCLLGPQPNYWNLVLFIIAIIFIIVTLYNLFFRTSVKDLLGRFEVFITKNVQRLLGGWFLS